MNMVDQELTMERQAVSGYDDSPPLMLTFAPNWPLRTVLFRIAGTAMILCASGMWLMPSVQADGGLMFIKLGVSVFFFFCGLALLMRNHEHNQPDAFFDPIRNEVRVLQKNDRGRPETILRRSYDSLGSVDFGTNSVELFDVDGSLMMRLLIDDEEVRKGLRSQLQRVVNVTG